MHRDKRGQPKLLSPGRPDLPAYRPHSGSILI
jgi:hypothetical protein